MNDDERLKRTFDKLREDDARRMPSFEAVKKKRRPKVSFLAIAAPVVAMAAAFLIWIGSTTMRSDAPAAVAAAAAPASHADKESGAQGRVALAPKSVVDDAPLDFLLDVPLLRGTPNFDSSLLQGSVR